jgi:hypothetical protein
MIKLPDFRLLEGHVPRNVIGHFFGEFILSFVVLKKGYGLIEELDLLDPLEEGVEVFFLLEEGGKDPQGNRQGGEALPVVEEVLGFFMKPFFKALPVFFLT